MWSVLKSDFTEFVTTVTSEATDTLNQLDVQLDRPETTGRNNGRGLYDLDTGMMLDGQEEEDDDDVDDDTHDTTTIVTDTQPQLTLQEMKEALYSVDQVFLDPLKEQNDDDDTATIPTQETLDAKTQEIVNLLQNDKRLEVAFARLTDQVEYKDFWMRYFARLGNDDLVTQTYQTYFSQIQTIHQQQQQQQQQIDHDRRRSEKERAGSALKSVTNFLGGAVKRLIADEDDDVKDDGRKKQDDHKGGDWVTSGGGGGGAMSFFQVSARPPFVLNTAVSDDDEEEEEEEEQLGWDDDDDDDQEEEEQDGQDQDGQIEFKDAEKERLLEELEQAISERDMLHKTVEMQTEEIKKLKEGVASNVESEQVEAFKMQLFEKEAEMAALRARIEDDHDRVEADHGSENEQLSTQRLAAQDLRLKLLERDSEIAQLKKEIETAARNTEVFTQGSSGDGNYAELQEKLDSALSELESQKAATKTLTAEKTGLSVQLESMKSEIERLLAERNALRKAQQQSGIESEEQLKAAFKELSETKSQLGNLLSQNQQLQSAMEDTKARLASAEIQQRSTQTMVSTKEEELAEALRSLEVAKHELEATKTDLATALVAQAPAVRPSSPGSTSTGVKVYSPVPDPAPLTQSEPAPKGDDEDGSDWGDW